MAYDTEAASLIDAIMDSTVGPNSRLPLLGDWVDPAGPRYDQFTVRTSLR